MIKKFVKNTMLVIAFLVAVSLISSSSLSITIRNISKPKKLYFTEVEEEISNGLAPLRKQIPIPSEMKSISTKQAPIGRDCYTMYGYKANPTPEKIINFDTCEPGEIEEIAPTGSDDFIAGATCSMYFLFGCENGSGKLWEIDIETGDMTLIGGGGVSLNGLAWDPITNRLFGVSSHYPSNDKLWLIDQDTGEQDEIGEINLQYVIGMAFDACGVLYGWDLVQDSLHIINPDTLDVETVGPLGIDLNYAQDGDFHWESDRLYLTAYTTTGQLYVCDKETGECTLIGNFENGIQITGSSFDQCCPCVNHDVALKSIDFPETGPAGPDMKMQVTVKNEGDNTETFDAQMEINKNQSGSLLLDEDFSGPFPPEGWETDSWTQCNSSCCHESPCACLFPYNQVLPFIGGNITSKAVNASENKTCKLSFYLCANMIYPQYCNFYIKIRRNESSPWKDISPWDNPLGEQMEGDYFQVDIFSSEGCGEALQIRWEYIGYYYWYNYICLDTVSLVAIDDYYEYAELVEDITLDPGESMQIEFPSWTPTQWQDPEYENTWVDYPVHAFTILEGDQNPRNDYKHKLIELYFGFFHDVGASDVSCPESGPAQTFPVTGHVKNFGQYNESNFKTYAEIAELDINNPVELLTEEFSDSTFPPDGWTKTHDNWMYSSTNYSDGAPGEARFYYSPESTDIFRLFTPAIDTSEYGAIEIEFKHYVDHYTTPYTLKLETSEDGINWDVLWEIEPTGDVGPESISLLTINNVGSNTYVSWTFEGDSYYIDNWYVDDIFIKGYSLLGPEYEDNVVISIIKPGEELEVKFSDWTPDFLQYETTSTKKYVVNVWTDLEEPEDQNPVNDLFKKLITLDFFHDVGIKNISSPSNPRNGFVKSKTFAPPLPEIYIQPGTENIDVFVENNGTFPELDLTCYAEIWEFITNESGSLVYEDEITDIDLEEPVGGTKLLNFDDYTFAYEGVYGLYLDLPLEIDDYPESNHEELMIGVDGSSPFSWIEEMDPPEPDGENGWYVSDITLTICAEDPEIQPGIPGSGIHGIVVNGQFFLGDCITIIIDPDDGDDIVIEYWAVDNVGNVETPHNKFTIDMDQTYPNLDLTYEIIGGNPIVGWDLLFTATATDDISGMDRVEFYLNDVWQETIMGSGPIYEWEFRYYGGLNLVVTAWGFDKAGNMEYDDVIDPKTIIYNQNSQQQSQSHTNSYFKNKLLQRLFVIPGERDIDD